MRILLTGGTGFIGRALVPRLQRDGHTVVVWARSEVRARGRLGADVDIVPSSNDAGTLARALDGCDAIVNLAGAPIVGRRWTRRRRAVLRESRVGVTTLLVAALAQSRRRPGVLVSGSAIGAYGNRGDEVLSEASAPGDGFLAELCREWEAAALEASRLGLRVVLLRTGIALGRDGGALAPLALPFKLGVGGRIGTGRQCVSWIHLHDLVAVIVEALTCDRLSGPVNAVAPSPETNRAFARVLGRVLHRPSLIPAPALALRAILGESARVLLDSQRVEPAVLLRHGFRFRFAALEPALADVLRERTVAIGAFLRPADPGGSEAGRHYLAARRPVYELRSTTRVEAPVAETFAFFSRAENLGMLTPASMRFSIQGRPPDIAENAAIEYRLRVGPVPLTWRSRIVSWMPGIRFVDLQERGPYRSWWHEHAFRADGSSTVMQDRVCYAPPFGVLGRVANALFIAPALRRIFQYRAEIIQLRFGRS